MTQESRLVIVIDSRNAERNTRAVADELANLTNKGVQADTQMTAMSSSIKSLVGYMGGLLTINKAIAMADSYTQMAARIRNATHSAEEYTLVQDRLLKTANTTYRQLGEAQEVYLSMAGGMKSLGKSTKDTLDLTDSLSFSFTHNATRVDQAQSAMDSLSKSMARGKVDGDAWISIVTGADNVIADMAKTTDKTEAEIRKLGAEGKVSLEDLIKTLILTRDENEKLANNMENSLADGFTKLSNEVTVYLGKANEATSATGVMAGSLGVLADNLDMVANTGAAIGLGYVTTALLTKGAVVKKSIVDSIARRAADQAEIQSQLQLAAVEVKRARQVEALATQEVHLARQELNSATTRTERAAATMRLTQAEIALGIASKQTTTVVAENTVIQNANNASKRTGILTSTGLLGILGGPVGLGVTVATVAASYLLMSDNTAESTKSLRENNVAVGDAVTAYRVLNDIQKVSQLVVEKEKLDDLNEAYRQATTALDVYASGMSSANEFVTESQVELSKLLSEYKKTGNLEKFNSAVQSSAKISQTAKDEVASLASKVDAAGNSAKTQKEFISQLGTAVKGVGDKAKESATEVAGLSEKIKELFNEADKNSINSTVTAALASRGYNDEMISIVNKYMTVEGSITKNLQGQSVFRDEIKAKIKQEYDAVMKAKNAVDFRNEAEKKTTKELEKQQKVLQTSAKVQANAAKYNFGGLESKYNLPNGMLSALHAIETGNSGKTNQVNKQSGATGGFQFLKGTANQYGVKDRTDMAQSAEGAAKYMAYLLKLFKGDLEKAVRAYHAGEGNVQKGKNIGKYNNDYWQKFKGYSAGANGYSAGDISSKDFEKILEDAAKLTEEQAKLRKSLELDVANEVTKIRENLKDKLEEIDKAGFSAEKAKELTAEYQARADNDIAIAQYALKTKLDDYEAFKKTESELLKQSFDEKKFYAARDLELSKDDRAKAVQFLDDQLKQEQALLLLSQETRLFQLREYLMSETAAMQERYRLEREQIRLNSKLTEEQKQREIELSKALQQEENRKRLNSAVQQWGGIQAKMNGTGDQYRLDQERFGRTDASHDVFDSQMAQTDQAAQDPNANMEAIAAQREAIWKAHHERMTAIEMSYQQDSLNMQLTQAQAVTGALSGMFGAMLGESSSAYRALYGAQQAFALAQAGMNVWKSASDAYANEPGTVWQKAGAAALATIESGTFVSMIQAATPQGFATGGKIRGAGTSTSDSIPIMASDEEYMVRAYAAEKLGTPTLDYINKHGELPQNTHRVGMGTMKAINSGKSMGGSASGGDVNIHNTITIASDGGATSQSDSKELGALINNAVLAVIRREQRQGGLLR